MSNKSVQVGVVIIELTCPICGESIPNVSNGRSLLWERQDVQILRTDDNTVLCPSCNTVLSIPHRVVFDPLHI